MIRDGKIVKHRDGTMGQNDLRGVHEKANQTRKEKDTGAQAQTTTREKGAVATAGKKQVIKSYSRALTHERGKVVSTQQNEQKESISTRTNKAHCIPILDTKDYLFDCYYANAQSLNNKMDEFREVVKVLKPKVIGITKSCSEGKSVLPHTEMIVEEGSFSILRIAYSQHHVQN